MWELAHKEGWVLKNWSFRTVVLEETLESPLDCKEIKPVSPKGSQPWVLIGRTVAEAEVPILWIPDVKSWLIGKDPDAGENWGQEEKGVTKDQIVGWLHWLNGLEFEQTQRDSEGQRSLACCSSWGHRVRHDLATEQQQSPTLFFCLWISSFPSTICWKNFLFPMEWFLHPCHELFDPICEGLFGGFLVYSFIFCLFASVRLFWLQ